MERSALANMEGKLWHDLEKRASMRVHIHIYVYILCMYICMHILVYFMRTYCISISFICIYIYHMTYFTLHAANYVIFWTTVSGVATFEGSS